MTEEKKGDGVEYLIQKVSNIDYKNSPAEAFLELYRCVNILKEKIRPYRQLMDAEREMESVNWCLNQIFGFKNSTYDSYHECNFYAHQKRVVEAGKQVIDGMKTLNESTNG